MRSGQRILALATVLAAVSTPAFGQVTVGTHNDGQNCVPFQCYTFLGGTEYQQVYAASAFSAPLSINSIQFFDSQHSGALFSGNVFTISFSEANPLTVAPGTITNSYAANIGANPAVFFSGILSGDATAPILGTPYWYDPSLGNLLMDVVLGPTPEDGVWQGALDFGCDANVGRAYDGLAPNTPETCDVGQYDPGFGLVTEFNGTVPEPVTMVLLGTGLLGIGGVRLRRRQRPVG